MRGASLSRYEGVFCSGSSFTEGQGLEEKPWNHTGRWEAVGRPLEPGVRECVCIQVSTCECAYV